MAENTDPKQIDATEDVEVVAHSEEEEAEAGCVINNSSQM